MIPPRFSQLFFCKTRRVLGFAAATLPWRLGMAAFERSLGCMNRVFGGNPCNPGFKQGEVILHFAELASDLLLRPSEFVMIQTITLPISKGMLTLTFWIFLQKFGFQGYHQMLLISQYDHCEIQAQAMMSNMRRT